MMNIDTLVREFEITLLHVREAHYEYFLHERASSLGVQDSRPWVSKTRLRWLVPSATEPVLMS